MSKGQIGKSGGERPSQVQACFSDRTNQQWMFTALIISGVAITTLAILIGVGTGIIKNIPPSPLYNAPPPVPPWLMDAATMIGYKNAITILAAGSALGLGLIGGGAWGLARNTLTRSRSTQHFNV